MLRLVTVLAVLCLLAGASHAQQSIRSDSIEPMVRHVHRNGQSFFEISADKFIRATPRQAWLVLTDYERLPEFVPNLEASKIISRDGNQAVLEQQSSAGFLFIAQHIRMLVRVTEQPYSTIDVAFLSGDMKRYAARWEIVPAREDGVEGAHIHYSGQLEPDFFVPPLVGEAVVENDVKKMIDAVAREIVTRK